MDMQRSSESRSSNPLHDLLEEEKRIQMSKGELMGRKQDGSLLTDMEFEKLRADVVSDGR